MSSLIDTKEGNPDAVIKFKSSHYILYKYHRPQGSRKPTQNPAINKRGAGDGDFAGQRERVREREVGAKAEW